MELDEPDPPETELAPPLPSFPAFYREHYRRAVRLAVVLTGSSAAAEDLVQDVMADAHRRWTHLQEYEQPAAWVSRAVANRSVSWRRRAAVAGKGLIRLGSQAEAPYGLTTTDWELWRHVRALPPRQAQVVALVYIEGLTIAAAAELLGIAVPTAKTSLARAKERLARELSDWRTS